MGKSSINGPDYVRMIFGLSANRPRPNSPLKSCNKAASNAWSQKKQREKKTWNLSKSADVPRISDWSPKVLQGP